MATTADIPRLEMLQVADMVAREKSIEREEVLEAMEQAIQKAGRAKYGLEHDIRAEIDRKTGEIRLLRYMQVADPVENENVQVSVAEAQRRNPEAQVGDFLTDELPPIDFGRVAAQTAKQVITQRMRESERKRQYEEFKDRVGEIVSGVVKRVDYGNVTVDLQRAEGVIRRDESIPRESLRVNDRVRAYIFDVREEPRGPQIFLSRSHPQFMAKLFTQEVPEIYDGIIEIKAVARDPGSRAKIAVLSHDSSIDPIGACVGMRGSRVQAVVQELQGEKVDIIPWSPEPANFIVNALAPAEVSKVLMDEEKNKAEVVVPDDQLSLAIGRRGQNVKLASQLTGWEIDIMTEAEESERRQKETRERTELFKEALDVDDVIAHLLVAEGYATVEDISESAVEDLTTVEGFDEDIATELQRRAREYIEKRDAELADKLAELGMDEAVRSIEGLTLPMLVALGEKGVKTLDDLGDLASDELREIVGESTLDASAANAIIMKAREHWFPAEEAAGEAAKA
ncbi:NusA antitermination factor [Enhydrobacter aerosaccus]|uniref:Transcription termination/antitermination protein NusA n=1 Tax=Enhydrobacter aerosaccus TaxID=225324 RepID=A0A1T4TKH0_9HYPH|nr:transcription termination factor NusA [Enhydrobacter aerosaccus]SKA40955.1 NusA antitermination factor [Enhydrobacter aerosaccus]